MEEQNLTRQERRELRRQEKSDASKRLGRARLIKKAALWGITAAVLGGAVFAMIKLGGNSTPLQAGTLSKAVTAEDWGKGNTEATLTLVEYSDFQCPACGAYYPVLKQLNQELGDKLRIVYRHFPLRQVHKNANLAAQAAEAAGKQEKFWEMHDIIFEHPREWSESNGAKDIFIKYAKALNLDSGRFANDLDSREVKDAVDDDYQSGLDSRVNSTPTFFLNGKRIENPKGYDEFKKLIEGTLNVSP